MHSQRQEAISSVPAKNPDFDYKGVAKDADGLILMNYDEHYPGSAAGPVASQDWFVDNLKYALKEIPRTS